MKSVGVFELRVAWIALAVLLLAVFWGPAMAPWIVLGAVPWGAGAAVLWNGAAGGRAAAQFSEALRWAEARVACIVLAAWLVVVTRLMTLAASLLIVAGVGAVLLIAAAVLREGAVRRILVASTVVTVSLTTALDVFELALRFPSVATRIGAPSELARWGDRYDRLWERNVLGLRSPYETIARTTSGPRVLALGDSFTWGSKIAETDSTWPARLERRLRRQLQAGELQVINLAERGFTMANEAERLRRLGWQFDPDLVIVQFFVNDSYESGPNFERQGGAEARPYQRHLLPVRMREGAIRNSALLPLIDQGLSRLVGQPALTEQFRPFYAAQARGWGQLRSALREMGDSSSARSVPIVLVLFPALLPGRWTTSDYPLREFYSQVGDEAKRAGFHVVDLIPEFVTRSDDDWRTWWATPYDSHPGPAAHAVVAAAIAQLVSDRSWLTEFEAATVAVGRR